MDEIRSEGGGGQGDAETARTQRLIAVEGRQGLRVSSNNLHLEQ